MMVEDYGAQILLPIAITTTEFVSALVITNSCLKYIQALMQSLQAEAKDIVEAVKEGPQLKMSVTKSRIFTITGILPSQRCCQQLVKYRQFQEGVAGNSIVATLKLTPLPSTSDVPSQSQ